MKVKRVSEGCCGMEYGKVYEAEWVFVDLYIRIKLPNGEWTSHHWFPKCFEVVS